MRVDLAQEFALKVWNERKRPSPGLRTRGLEAVMVVSKCEPDGAASGFVTLRVVTLPGHFISKPERRYLCVHQTPPKNSSPQSGVKTDSEGCIAALIASQGYNGPKNGPLSIAKPESPVL